MNIKKLAKKIKRIHDSLRKHPVYKEYPIVYNDVLQISEVSVVNDSSFRAVVIGDTRNVPEARGYMYLFYTADEDEKMPPVSEIVKRLSIVAQGKPLNRDNATYIDWEQYGSLEKQRAYFAEILAREE